MHTDATAHPASIGNSVLATGASRYLAHVKEARQAEAYAATTNVVKAWHGLLCPTVLTTRSPLPVGHANLSQTQEEPYESTIRGFSALMARRLLEEQKTHATKWARKERPVCKKRRLQP